MKAQLQNKALLITIWTAFLLLTAGYCYTHYRLKFDHKKLLENSYFRQSQFLEEKYKQEITVKDLLSENCPEFPFKSDLTTIISAYRSLKSYLYLLHQRYGAGWYILEKRRAGDQGLDYLVYDNSSHNIIRKRYEIPAHKLVKKSVEELSFLKDLFVDFSSRDISDEEKDLSKRNKLVFGEKYEDEKQKYEAERDSTDIYIFHQLTSIAGLFYALNGDPELPFMADSFSLRSWHAAHGYPFSSGSVNGLDGSFPRLHPYYAIFWIDDWTPGPPALCGALTFRPGLDILHP
ncbi:MAG: hypothetical protein PHQ23_09165 [Candidatus Wallbacteria bacterium]|nr:hypothetical protein [Candidatus Wallbacteria bacterium]